MTTSIGQTKNNILTLLPNWTLLPNVTTFYTITRSFSSRYVFLSHFELACVIMFRQISPETWLVSERVSFEHISVLLFYVIVLMFELPTEFSGLLYIKRSLDSNFRMFVFSSQLCKLIRTLKKPNFDCKFIVQFVTQHMSQWGRGTFRSSSHNRICCCQWHLCFIWTIDKR